MGAVLTLCLTWGETAPSALQNQRTQFAIRTDWWGGVALVLMEVDFVNDSLNVTKTQELFLLDELKLEMYCNAS